MSDTFLLGAGFSKAISPHMPTMMELGRSVLGTFGHARPPFPASMSDDSFEDWLTYLGSDLPWLDSADQARNRGAFLTVAREVSRIVRRREELARQAAMPDWLRALMAYWHEQRASVVTFNYDTLVEAAYTETVAVRSRPDSVDNYVSYRHIVHAPVTDLASRTAGVFGHTPVETLTLVKLHGCHSWLYSGRETFWGETIFSAYGRPGWSSGLDYRYPGLGDDKESLVVPPAAGKSSFFQNETVRGEWKRAREMLSGATDVWIVGYSLPPGDQLARQLLQSGCRPGQRVHVVNPDESVVDRIAAAVPSSSVLPTVVEAEPLPALARRLVPSSMHPIAFKKPPSESTPD